MNLAQLNLFLNVFAGPMNSTNHYLMLQIVLTFKQNYPEWLFKDFMVLFWHFISRICSYKKIRKHHIHDLRSSEKHLSEPINNKHNKIKSTVAHNCILRLESTNRTADIYKKCRSSLVSTAMKKVSASITTSSYKVSYNRIRLFELWYKYQSLQPDFRWLLSNITIYHHYDI